MSPLDWAGPRTTRRDAFSGLAPSSRSIELRCLAARAYVLQARRVGVEENAMDMAVRDPEQKSGGRLVAVIEDDRWLAVEVVHFGLKT